MNGFYLPILSKLSVRKLTFLTLLTLSFSFPLFGQPANLAPIANNVVANTITEVGRQGIQAPLAYDAEGSVSTYTLVSVPASGSLYLGASGGNPLIANTILTAAQAANLYYQPPTHTEYILFIPTTVVTPGTYTFTYRSTDNNGVISNQATYSIPVGTANTPVLPTPATIIQSYLPNTAAQTTIIGLKATGGTIDGYRLTSLPLASQGVLYTSNTTTGTRTAITILTNGLYNLTTAQAANLWFDPAPGFAGTSTFSYEASNTSSTSYSTATTYSIPVYSPPVANPVNAPSLANTAPVTAIPDLSAADAVGAVASFKLWSLPNSGTLYLNGTPITASNVSAVHTASSGKLTGLTYKPTPGFVGNAVFTFTATDDDGYTSAPVNYTIPITADNNQAVYSEPNIYSAQAITNGFVLARATDADGAIVKAVVTGAALPGFMGLQADGSIILNGTPSIGTYSSQITTTDTHGGYSVNVPVTITINSDLYQANNAAVNTGENCYRLTSATNSQRGEIWRTTPINLNQSFQISFNAYFGTRDADGADGIAFGLQRQAPNPLFAAGETGEGIGFGHGTSTAVPRTGGITPSIAVEFDTFQNPTAGGETVEPGSDHIAIFQNGEERLPLGTPVVASSTSTNIEDGKYHPVRIIWNAQAKTLYVYFGGSLRTQYTGNIIATIFENNPSVYFGFTASTGGYNNEHSICELTFILLDADQDGVADNEDLDDDNDGIPDTLESNGLNPSADHDSDGIANYQDANFPNGDYNSGTGINRIFDKDGDGVINAFDLDADNDGITDVVEANDGKANVTGYDPQTSRLTGPIEANGMPAVAQTNNNGISLFTIGDKDQDGSKDFLDVDADADGILDNREAQGNIPILVNKPADADKDGLDDTYDVSCGCLTPGVSLTPLNFDVAGPPDYLDIDADSDGILDNIEGQGDVPIVVVTPLDTDQDGLDNIYDATCGCLVNGKAILPVDTDTDGQPDFRDLDTDNDFMPDYVEAFDVNDNGYAMDDYHLMTTTFIAKASWPANTYYTISETPETSPPNWLKMKFGTGTGSFLSANESSYHDTDQDGLVDLMDTNNFGWSPATYNASYRTSDNVTPLPVELLSFKAEVKNNTVRLSWSTGSEHNNDFFEIERSTNGIHFTSIGREKGLGNSNEPQTYHFTDHHPINKVGYYRLKQVDWDGSVEYSKIIAVPRSSGKAIITMVSLFPNPAREIVNLDLTALPAEGYHLSLINPAGQVIRQVTLQGDRVVSLELRGLAHGKYIIHIYREDFFQNLNLLKL